MNKEFQIERRKKAKELHKKGWPIRKIAAHLVVSKTSVTRWVKTTDDSIELDLRGWQKGKTRRHSTITKERICSLRRELEKEDSFFYGNTVIQKNYLQLYGESLSISFIYRILKENNLVKHQNKKEKGKSRYMNYPNYTLSKLGKRVMSVDFIGPKYLAGSNEKINFITCKYIRPDKVGIARRIDGQTSENAILFLEDIWKKYPIPDVLKVDNDAAFGSNLSAKKCIGKFTLFLLNYGITPLYIAPRSPWNNGDVEGYNSVFSKHFWNKLQFTDEEEIDVQLNSFNVEYEKFSLLSDNNPTDLVDKYIQNIEEVDPRNKVVSKFKAHNIYFLRIVRRKEGKGTDQEYGYIDILKEGIKIRKDLINLFVVVCIDLKNKEIRISTETESGKLIVEKTNKYTVKNIIYPDDILKNNIE
jgi:transposase